MRVRRRGPGLPTPSESRQGWMFMTVHVVTLKRSNLVGHINIMTVINQISGIRDVCMYRNMTSRHTVKKYVKYMACALTITAPSTLRNTKDLVVMGQWCGALEGGNVIRICYGAEFQISE